MASPHQRSFLGQVANLKISSKYSDLTIKCDGRTFQVHKAIVCSVSPLLEATVKHGTEEALTSVIEHKEYDADTLERMISYIYAQDYTVEKGKAPNSAGAVAKDVPKMGSSGAIPGGQAGSDQQKKVQGDSPAVAGIPAIQVASMAQGSSPSSSNFVLIAHVRVFGIADYYSIPLLKTLAVSKFKSAAQNDWTITGFIDVIREVGARSPDSDRTMRDALRVLALEHVNELVASDSFMEDLAMLEDVQDFAADLLREVVRTHLKTKAELKSVIRALEQSVGEEEQRVKQLNDELSLANVRHASELSEKDRQCEKITRKMDNLISAIHLLPRYCNNTGCSVDYGELTVEDGTHSICAGADWVLRCTACRCKLVVRYPE